MSPSKWQKQIDPWCNGNTLDFGSSIQGSSPCGSTIFSYGVNETATFNSFFYNNINNLAIDGDIGNGTKRAIRALVRAYYYCENSALPDANRILAHGDSRISNTRIQAFVDRCVDNTIIPTDTDHNIIRGFYNWFSSNIDFSNISLNTTT